MPTDPFATLLADPPDLPVRHGLAQLGKALTGGGTAVLQSPPGSGKTTLVPPTLAAGSGARVVVTQPRRIAARAAAARLSHLIERPLGSDVGFSVRGERRVSPGTRVEVVTAGLLLRRLQADPELPGVGAVVLDEVHERHLDTDLLLALLVDVRSALREDLTVVAMSATIEAERVAAVLGPATPVVTVPGRLHPVTTHWRPPPATAARLDQRGTTPAFLDHVATTTGEAMTAHDGDALVFLPGAREIDDVVRRLRSAGALPAGTDVLALHGRLPPAEQDRALRKGRRRRVVVSSAVAESSLTVPGVRIVVDAGLARVPRTDQNRGLAGLVTRSVSQAAAEQRAGRAGRESPGQVYRCWSQVDHARLQAHPAPQIHTADLTSAMLELARWGTPRGEGLNLLDEPPASSVQAAEAALMELGAIDAAGMITARGRAIADVGVDPRLGRALLDGAGEVGAALAAETVAMLDQDSPAPGGDLTALLRQLRRGGPGTGAWEQQRRRLRTALSGSGAHSPAPAEAPPGRQSVDGGTKLDLAVGTVTALAHPGRIARLRPGGSSYLMVGGTGARLAPGSALAGSSWLAIADAARSPGQSDAIIRAAAPIDEATALEAAGHALSEEREVAWHEGRIRARQVLNLGAIELSSQRLADPGPGLVARAVREGLQAQGLNLIGWPAAAARLRRRLLFLHAALGAPWPDVSDEALLDAIEEWLGPDLARVRTTADLRRIDTTAALRRLLPWPHAGELDRLAPERIEVPSGSKIAVDYTDPQRPVLPVRIQEVFGWDQAPRLAGGRVPLVLELLSPASRPAAVTADLATFWASGYLQVRAELRGRYPKHPWPEDPTTATPTTRTKRASRRRG
ncbi:ATP-dependent helicase HrpB [Pseudactinotalea sp. Z1748]|uniref:ATP-dependent helicase HrpB n=1 Tax=Pseudactinotalea sp. Z1748 TaxID=3413027 RepID=UPI003C7B1ACE